MKFMLVKGSVNAVPINAIHIAVGSAPYVFTRGFEPTANTEYMKAEKTTASGPVISWKFNPAFKDSTTAPVMAAANASVSLLPIFSLRNNADSTTTKMGPSEMSRPARPADTMVAAKFTDRWYSVTL